MAAAFPGTTMIMAALAISKSRILLLCVGCCSFLMMAMLRLNFLVSQASLAGVREDGAPFMRVRRPANNNNASYVEKNVSIEYVRLKQDSSIQRPVSKQGVSIPKLSSAADGARAEKMENATNIHFPNYFTSQIPLESLIERDNLLSVFSGCSIAAWTYTGVTFHKAKVRFYDDCKCYNDEHNMTGRDVSSHTAVSLLKSSDTLYVELKKISHFVIYTLPKITVDVVLISGQNHLVPQKPQKLDYVWSQDDFDAIVNNPYITHWFMMNMDVYAQDPDHVKLHPFPYGLGSISKHTPDTAQVGMNPMHAFKDELKAFDVIKNNSIFVGYFTMRTNKEQRKLVPQGEKLHPIQHFRKMHESSYVVSPNGDRPDCYRHYEAIGLGAMPITQMNPKYYRHLAGNVIFNNTNWNLTELEVTLPREPKVNRRLVFEEYWMEYMERIVGRPLRWWDSTNQIRCSLADITDSVKGMIA